MLCISCWGWGGGLTAPPGGRKAIPGLLAAPALGKGLVAFLEGIDGGLG